MPQSARVYHTRLGEFRFNTGLIVNQWGETYTDKGYWFKWWKRSKSLGFVKVFDIGYGYKWIQMIWIQLRKNK